jgi:hypothetical protein
VGKSRAEQSTTSLIAADDFEDKVGETRDIATANANANADADEAMPMPRQ